jgi:O-antigen/teichoic acid export membrane protein
MTLSRVQAGVDPQPTPKLGPFARLTKAIARSDLARKVGETYATQTVAMLVTLATTIVSSRLLGPAGRGLYAVAAAIGVIGVQFANLGLHASNTYFVAKDRGLLPKLLGNSLVNSAAIGGGAALAASAVFYLKPHLAPLHGALLALGLVWVPVGLAYLLMQNLLLGIQDVRAFNKIELFSKIVGLALVAALAFAHFPSVVAVFSAAMAALVFGSIWAFRRLRHAGGRPSVSLALFRNNLSVGVRAYLVAVFGYLVLRIDLLMVQYMLGAKDSGYYSVAANMASYFTLLPTAVGAILFPKLSGSSDPVQKLRTTKKAAGVTAMFLVPLAGVSWLVARPFVQLMFGKAFLPAADAYIWLLPGVVFLGVETVAVQLLNSFGYPVSVIAIWFFSLLLNVALNLWAIPAYGIIGASAVSSITYTVASRLVIYMIFSYRIDRYGDTPGEGGALLAIDRQ